MIPILNSTVDSFGWFYVCCVIRFSNDQQIFAIIVHDMYQRKMLLNTNISFLKTNVRNVFCKYDKYLNGNFDKANSCFSFNKI